MVKNAILAKALHKAVESNHISLKAPQRYGILQEPTKKPKAAIKKPKTAAKEPKISNKKPVTPKKRATPKKRVTPAKKAVSAEKATPSKAGNSYTKA